MKLETLLYEKSGPVAVLTLNRPDRLNAIDVVMAGELPQVWEDVKADDAVRVVVVTGAGERAFSTGFDVGNMAERKVSADAPGPLKELRFTAIQNRCYKPVVTAVGGMVCGGGLHFVADTDLLICSDDATFFDTHVNVGTVAGLEFIGLARRIPLGSVLRMALVGRSERLDARRAHALGLVGEVVPKARLRERALELAGQIAEASPTALMRTKRILWESLDVGLREAHERAWALLAKHIDHPDTREGAAAFAEKRAPKWAPPGATED
jgi:enoyl-CoA hydratase/carnithine racemase